MMRRSRQTGSNRSVVAEVQGWSACIVMGWPSTLCTVLFCNERRRYERSCQVRSAEYVKRSEKLLREEVVGIGRRRGVVSVGWAVASCLALHQ